MNKIIEISKFEVMSILSGLDTLDSDIVFDFDFTLTSADSEEVFFGLFRSVSWGGKRMLLSRYERLLFRLGKRFSYSLFASILKYEDQGTLSSVRAFFIDNFLENYASAILAERPKILVLSHCPQNLLRYLLCDSPNIIGRKAFQKQVNKKLYASKNKVIFSDSVTDFSGSWKVCYLIK